MNLTTNCTGVNASSFPGATAAAAEDTSGATIGAIFCVIISSISTTFGLFFQKIAQDRGGVCGNPFHHEMEAAAEDLEMFLEQDGAGLASNAAFKRELEEKG